MKNKIKYIFCINTGRSGSNYLGELFTYADGAISMHEMRPIGHSEEMREFLKGNHEPMRKLTKKKLNIINDSCPNGEVYIETSHMFIKGFGWILAEILPHDEIGVIILNRDKSKIVSSFHSIDSVALTYRGQNWMITPDIEKPLIQPPGFFGKYRETYALMKLLKLIENKLHGLIKKILPNKKIEQLKIFNRYNFQCLEWYVDEIHALGEKFQQDHPKITFKSLDLSDLNDLKKVEELFEYFGLTAKEGLPKVVGKPTNLKEKFKQKT